MSSSNRVTPKLEISLRQQLIRCLFSISIAIFFLAAHGCVPTSAQHGEQTGKQTAAEIETARVAKLLSDRGAVLTKDADGKIIAFQLPESLALSEAAWVYLEKLPDLQDLDLGAQHLGNDALKHVGKLTELRSLNLFGNPLDSISLTHITGLNKLETLYLYRTFIDDKGIESIAQLKSLERLNMFDTFLTDAGLDRLGTCKQLKHLSIGNSKAGNFPKSFFTPAGIKRLRKNLPETNITYWGQDDNRLDLPAVIGESKDTNSDPRYKPNISTPKVKAAPNLAKRQNGFDWPTFLGPNGDGKSMERGLNLNWYDKPPKLAWHKKIGTGYAAPSISNGRLLLYHRVRNVNGDKENGRFLERLSCLHSETGKTTWEVDFPTDYADLNGYGDGPRSTPVIDGHRVYLLSPKGMLRCLQIVDGKTIWSADLKAQFNCDLISYGVGTTPVVYGNQLLIIAGGKPANESDDKGADEKSKFEAGVVSIDKLTGVFQYGLGSSAASYATPVVRKVGGRDWCFAFTRDGLLGFNPESAKIDFEFPWRSNIAGCVNAATPVVVGNRVFISEAYSTGGAMLQFKANSAQPIWKDDRRRREKAMAVHWATPISHEGMLYGCSGRHSIDGLLMRQLANRQNSLARKNARPDFFDVRSRTPVESWRKRVADARQSNAKRIHDDGAAGRGKC